MKTKKPYMRRPEATGDKWISPKFKEKHHFDKQTIEPTEKVVVFLINMYATTKSGYLVEQESKKWTYAKPLLTNSIDKAMVFDKAPSKCFDFALRVGRYVPKYFYPVVLNLAECKHHANSSAWKDSKVWSKKSGEIKYF